MYKKLSIIIAVLLLTTTICSCSSSDANDKNASLKDVLAGDYSFNIGEDDPLCLAAFNNIAIAEDGYYFTNDTHQMLYYFDKATKKVVPVCNRPECTHDNSDCNAYVGEIRHYAGLWYYENKLYVLGYKGGIMGLYTISKDGSTRERLCDLFETGKNFSITTTIHRGYVYFSVDRGNDHMEVYSKKLDGKDEPELIFEFHGHNAMADFIRGYKNGVFISYEYYQDENNEDAMYAVLYYNRDNNTISELELEGYTDQLVVCEDAVIYRTDKEILKYNLNDKTSSVIYDKEPCGVNYDGKYIYLDNNVAIFTETTAQDKEYDVSRRHIVVADTSGNIVDDIKVETNGLCYFGDSDYLFIDMNEKYNGTKQKTIEKGDMIKGYWFEEIERLEAFDKSQIGTDKHEWIVLKEWEPDSIIG
ncbi:MAG: hypothetical protein K6F76_03595 [Clostridiales bacterium]|nr:hypothetical protein [Clostridiales bacterium]